MFKFLRRALPFLTVAMIAAGLYDAWIFYSRWRDGREAAAALQAKQAEEARRTIDMLGGDELKILGFYAVPAAIHPGEKANICYSVSGAKSVRMEPPVEELRPALSYCLQVSPAKTTEYKLTAEDGLGHMESAHFVLRIAAQ